MYKGCEHVGNPNIAEQIDDYVSTAQRPLAPRSRSEQDALDAADKHRATDAIFRLTRRVAALRYELAAAESVIKAKDEALRRTRELIAEQRQMDFDSYAICGVAETMDRDEAAIVAEYDATLAMIDEALTDGPPRDAGENGNG